MWLSAILAVLLQQPAATGKLELTSIHATHGLYGISRPDFTIPPGEQLFIAFDIVGLQPDAQGRMFFGTALEVEDSKGKSIFKDDFGAMLPVVNLLGGMRMAHSVLINTGIDQAPGTYRAKVTVRDYQSKKEASFSKDFTVSQPEFGILRVQLCYDVFAQMPAPPAGAAGQKLFLNFVPAHFKRDAKQEASVAVELNVLDDRGNPTAARPLTGTYTNLGPDVTWLQLRFEIPLQRPGQFKIVLKATDQVAKKTVTLNMPLHVLEIK